MSIGKEMVVIVWCLNLPTYKYKYLSVICLPFCSACIELHRLLKLIENTISKHAEFKSKGYELYTTI